MTDGQRHCVHCGLEVEDRGHPFITETSVFHSVWVHVPGGYTACFPQQGGRSPRAVALDEEDDD